MLQNNMLKTLHFIVTGRVQGVFFRASCRHAASRYGITGWVRNLPDGRVEGMATGEPDPLDAFCKWLEHGPDLAQVSGVTVNDVAYCQYDSFEVR